MKCSHIHIFIFDVISGCYRVRIAVVKARTRAYACRSECRGPGYLLCSRTCTDYRERKGLRADSCAEARRVLVSLAGP